MCQIAFSASGDEQELGRWREDPRLWDWKVEKMVRERNIGVPDVDVLCLQTHQEGARRLDLDTWERSP